jgi:hypothetical protein
VKTILACIGCLLLSAAAYAAPAVTAYDVEVLVFENLLPELEGGELWTRSVAEKSAPDVTGAIVIDQLVPAETTLSGAASTLQRSGTYRVLTHRRWRQTAEEKSASKPVRLRNPDGQLDGTLRFYMSRFLHVDVDLALQNQLSIDRTSAREDAGHQLLRPPQTRGAGADYACGEGIGAAGCGVVGRLGIACSSSVRTLAMPDSRYCSISFSSMIPCALPAAGLTTTDIDA